MLLRRNDDTAVLGAAHACRQLVRAAGRKQAIERKAEHVVHKVDGTIGEKNSYGNDPVRTKG